MSDFLERLRTSSPDVDVPPVDVVRTRARRIVRRRYVLVSTSAVVVALIAGAGIYVRGGPSVSHNRTTSEAAGSALISTAAPGGASSGATSGRTAESGAGAVADAAATPGTGADRYGASAKQSAPMMAAAAPLNVSLTVKQVSVGRGVDLTLKVCNAGSSSVTREFKTTQRYDFEVSRAKTVVWRWSTDRSFAESTGAETWKAHECKSWTETWNGTDNEGKPAAPGSYQAVGMVAFGGEKSKPVSFCLDVC